MSEIFDLNQEFNNDPNAKINGTIGTIVDDYGRSLILPIVRQKASEIVVGNFNYLPIEGDPIYLQRVKEFLDFPDHKIQSTCGGTNALYLWSRLNPVKRLIIRKPSWENHYQIFSDYYLMEWESELELKNLMIANPTTPVLLQLADNPSGKYIDFKKISRLGNPALFDVAYLGLGKPIDEDLKILHMFKNPDIAVSFSKIMTLYQHRVGALLTKNNWDMSGYFRKMNSNPPAFGQFVAREVFSIEWLMQLDEVRQMINRRRFTPGYGLYSLLPLSKERINQLKRKGIYLLSNGRINYGGIKIDDIDILKREI